MTRQQGPRPKKLTVDQRLSRLEAEVDRLRRMVYQEEIGVPMMDGTTAVPTPVSAHEIAQRTPPHTTVAKRHYPKVDEAAEKPLPPEAGMDHLPDDEVEPMTDDDGREQ